MKLIFSTTSIILQFYGDEKPQTEPMNYIYLKPVETIWHHQSSTGVQTSLAVVFEPSSSLISASSSSSIRVLVEGK